MHKNKYIYRDLKPENILIDKEGHVKLTDFGLSKILKDEESKTYTMCGTAEYLAPEVVLEKGYNMSCDWFSFGAVMFEMLCGRRPYQRKGKKIDPRMYLTPIKIPNNLSEGAQDLLSKLLEINPRKRIGYNSADEIKNHPYFKGVDFNKVYLRQTTPPFIPKLSSVTDLRYFDPGFTSENIDSYDDNFLKIKGGLDFEGFSYQPMSESDSIELEDKSKDTTNNTSNVM